MQPELILLMNSMSEAFMADRPGAEKQARRIAGNAARLYRSGA
jgi:hypothetical protein